MKRILFLLTASLMMLSIGFSAAPLMVLAYSNSGHAWYKGNPTYVEVTLDPSILSAWIPAIARAEAAWNNAGARFRFVAGSSHGHVVSFKTLSYTTIVAATYIREGWSNGYITDRDTEINARFSWDVNGDPNKYDIGNAMTHEFGHWLMLNDLYNNADLWKTMYGNGWPGRTDQKSLDQDDINGIRAIYP